MVGGTRRLREVTPPLFASFHGKPAVCLFCCAESACSPQLWCSAALSVTLTLFPFCLCCFLTVFITILPLVLFHSYSHILPFLLVFTPSLPLAHAYPHKLNFPPTVLPHFQRTLPTLHPVARIMTLLTTQTHGGSGYGPAKSSRSPTSITSLAPLSSLGRVGETEK